MANVPPPHHRQRRLEELQLAQQTLNPNHNLIRPLYKITTQPFDTGIHTRRSIPKGTLILEEAPLFSIPDLENPTTPENIFAIRNSASQHLQAYCSLPNASNFQQQPPGYEHIFTRHSFLVSTTTHEGTTRTTRGIFPTALHLSHSCVPNAYASFNPTLDALTIHAIFDIPANSEITINYQPFNAYDSATARRTHLYDNYSTTCNCRHCLHLLGQTPTYHLTRSNRITMLKLHQDIVTSHSSHNDNIFARSHRLDNIHTLQHMLEKEGTIYPALSEVYEWEAEAWAYESRLPQIEAVVDERNCGAKVLEAGRKKLALDLRCTGRESEVVERTLDWLVKLGM